MRRLLRLACIAAVLALAMGAAAMVSALGQEAGATKVTAQERARQLRLEEARMQAHAARAALDEARAMAEGGVGSQQQVMERELDLLRAERALAEIEAMEGRRISVQLQGVPVQEAFTAIFKDSDESFMLHPDVNNLPYAITLNLKDVSLESAVRMVCKLYNLEYETDNEGLWVIMPGSGFVTVAGARVPIIGTVTTVSGTQGGKTELLRDIHFSRGGGGVGLIEAPERPSFPGEERLVDLDVKDAPLSEVASLLSFQAVPRPKPEEPLLDFWQNMNVELIVGGAVKDVKVTAKIAKWPLGEVLDMLLAQTGLVCTVEPSRGRLLRERSGWSYNPDGRQVPTDLVTGEVGYATVRVYLVPAPELRASGVRLSGGGGPGFGVQEALERPSFAGEERLVDLDVKEAPLSEVASRLSFKAVPRPKGAPPDMDSWLNANVEMIVDDTVKDLKVTATIAKWPLGEVLEMLLAQTGLVCTVDPATSTSGSGRRVGPPLDITRDPVTGELVYPPPPTIRVYLVPAPELRVAGAGLPSLPLWPRLQSTREQWAPDAKVVQLYTKLGQLQADEVRALQVLRECPKCHAAAILPDWKYCPKCGAKLPEVKQPAEKGAKGE